MGSHGHGGQFPPTADPPDWNNLQVIQRNELPPRAYFFPHETIEDALSRASPKSTGELLSGSWQFQHFESPFLAPSDFHRLDYDTKSWPAIHVPGMWQLQGYGKPQYTNVTYPFPVDPPRVPLSPNETGLYRRTFTVSQQLCERNRHFRLRFEGVDSAFHVWVNGQAVGYHQGSRNPAEFDISSNLHEGENVVAVQVYQYCDGSYLEDQDQWWLSGIYRDVWLLAFPETYISDVALQTVLSQDGGATLKATVEVAGSFAPSFVGGQSVRLQLLDGSRQLVGLAELALAPRLEFNLSLKTALSWTAETPHLYQVVVSIGQGHYVAQTVGFREVKMRNGNLLVNGVPVIFKGVNRHEHHPDSGRAVPYEYMKADLLMMKKHNVNAIRCCHQPNDPRFYDLCNELGFYVIDEADLETHGFAVVEENRSSPSERELPSETRADRVYDRAGRRWLAEDPQWEHAYVDRAERMIARDKNHPSVIIWSLGNEAFFGPNFVAMARTVRRMDPTRPIHYEGDSTDQVVDMHSMMYPSFEKIQDYLRSQEGRGPDAKPLVLCEYAHAMGNSPGALQEYVDMFHNEPLLQGGFIWEWANHGLRKKWSGGQVGYAYGGDFDEELHDGNFILDGLLFSDHTPTPAMSEVRNAYAPIKAEWSSRTERQFTITNLFDFIGLGRVVCQWRWLDEGTPATEWQALDLPRLLPKETVELTIPAVGLEDRIESKGRLLDLRFLLADDDKWAHKGFELAWSQLLVSRCHSRDNPHVLKPRTNEATWLPSSIERCLLYFVSSNEEAFRLDFDVLQGVVSRMTCSSQSFVSGPMTFGLWRPITDNDRLGFTHSTGHMWEKFQVKLARTHVQSTNWEYLHGMSQIALVCHARLASPSLEWAFELKFSYIFHASGSVEMSIQGTPTGHMPRILPKIGWTVPLAPGFERVQWYGRGPGESYRDKKAIKFGQYECSVDEMYTNYEYPQEGGNRTDTWWAILWNDQYRKGLRITSPSEQDGFNFSALHYRLEDIDAAKHPHELQKSRETFLCIDLDQAGVGTGACGPATLEKYECKARTFDFKVLLELVSSDNS